MKQIDRFTAPIITSHIATLQHYTLHRYRNGQEFYRHIPTDRPQTVVFRQAGLIVDVSILMSIYLYIHIRALIVSLQMVNNVKQSLSMSTDCVVLYLHNASLMFDVGSFVCLMSEKTAFRLLYCSCPQNVSVAHKITEMKYKCTIQAVDSRI